MRRLVAVLFWWIAVLLVGAGVLVRIFGWLDLPLGLWVGAGLMALGLNVLAGGDLTLGGGVRPFSARAMVSRAVLDVTSQMTDVGVQGSDDFERLVSVRVGRSVRPHFEVVDGVAHLNLRQNWPSVAGGVAWQALLGPDVLWDVNVRSLLGFLELDLREVRVDSVRVTNNLGGLRLSCPRRGRPQVSLETWLGDLEVVVPRGVGARIRLACGRLASVRADEAHFEQVDATTFATRDVESAEAVAEVAVTNRAGEIRLSRG